MFSEKGDGFVYVVLEILDPNLCFGSEQRNYVKYDQSKCLTVIGTFEDLSTAELVCSENRGARHILGSRFCRSMFNRVPFFQPEPNPFGGVGPNPFGGGGPNPFGGAGPNPFGPSTSTSTNTNTNPFAQGPPSFSFGNNPAANPFAQNPFHQIHQTQFDNRTYTQPRFTGRSPMDLS
ncbi:MAG: hypothetical protein Harvfovirus51_9 [Harvfovirus sp.]|uniref:Uncharacterized protein n=1 Tax=Harvfovirus sp. TaxID=2487768 RepID=A0A3G5A396_9VIRU|nr:MAG: hypothetical protein Harvfovirus51_9 [Harvfovirus sp.]